MTVSPVLCDPSASLPRFLERDLFRRSSLNNGQRVIPTSRLGGNGPAQVFPAALIKAKADLADGLGGVG